MAPGEINNFETFTVKDKAEFLDAIKIWVSILASELEGIPERRELEEQRAKLEDLLKSTSEMADTFFSKEEADSMMVRLQDLEEQMKRQLEEAAKSKEEADIKIKVLREEFEVLKASLGYMTKKNWAKSAMVKVFEWMKDPTNRKLLKSGADAARILLGEGPTPPTSSS
jgi:ABC-type phosphate transport system auxiliary subunit